MGILSYADLLAALPKYMKRNDLGAMLPIFLQVQEEYFNTEIFTRARRDSISLTPLSSQIALPNDWYRIIRVYWNGTPMNFFPNEFESGYAAGEATRIGYGYQIEGDTLSVSTPDLGAILRLDYYTTLEPLSTTNTSNWLLEDSPSVYLYGVLHEAASYIRDQTQLAYWLQKRDAAIQALQDDDSMSRYPESPLVMRRA